MIIDEKQLDDLLNTTLASVVDIAKNRSNAYTKYMAPEFAKLKTGLLNLINEATNKKYKSQHLEVAHPNPNKEKQHYAVMTENKSMAGDKNSPL